MKRIFFLLLFFISFASLAQVYPQLGARSNGLATATLCVDDVWAVNNNPGAFGAIEESGIGVSYENRFLLKELSTQSMVFGYHTEKSGNFGIHFQQFGFSLYREIEGGITYGMKLFNNFSAGVSVNYHRIRFAENVGSVDYGTANLVTASLGLFYQMSEDFDFGLSIQNISRTRLADFDDERLPTNFTLGMRYHFSEKAFWTVDVEKDIIHPINFKSGVEIQAHEILAVRFGINTFPFQSAFGLSIKLKNFQLDIASMYHTQLGLSPSGGLVYTF